MKEVTLNFKRYRLLEYSMQSNLLLKPYWESNQFCCVFQFLYVNKLFTIRKKDHLKYLKSKKKKSLKGCNITPNQHLNQSLQCKVTEMSQQ